MSLEKNRNPLQKNKSDMDFKPFPKNPGQAAFFLFQINFQKF